jgi:hypothetical protein
MASQLALIAGPQVDLQIITATVGKSGVSDL